MQRPLILGKPDAEKIRLHLDGLMAELQKVIPPGADVKTAVTQSLIGTLCQVFDVQHIHDIVRALADPQNAAFWAEQHRQKSGRIIL